MAAEHRPRAAVERLPLATSRIAETTSAAARDLWTNALAPDWTAANRAASVSSRVRKIIFVAGRMPRIAAAASGPVPSGRRKSRRITSGLSSAVACTQSATVPTLPTTCRSAWALIRAARPSATTRWSSTIRTRVAASPSSPGLSDGMARSSAKDTFLQPPLRRQYPAVKK